ncbi:MAG: alanine-zipper protein, partial [Dolichospermum sp.]
FNPSDFAGFSMGSDGYEPIIPDAQNRLLSKQLGLALVLWSGVFGYANTVWCRWATLDGVLLPTEHELAQEAQQQAQEAQQQAQEAQQQAKEAQQQAKEAQQQAQEAQQRAEGAELLLAQEQQRMEKLLAQLRAKGINPNEI